MTRPALEFNLPAALEASDPPEERGRGRDDVRLLVSRRSTGALEHRRFDDLPALLQPGDLLVVNRSQTIPAAIRGHVGDEAALLHLSTRRDDGSWVVELRRPAGAAGASAPWLEAIPGTVINLSGGATATLVGPATASSIPGRRIRLWSATISVSGPVDAFLARWGRPIRYGHVGRGRPLSAYQTIFADEPGSAEMPSAGRPFTAQMVNHLARRGVELVKVLLHCGVSSLEAGEAPPAERFSVSPETAERVNATLRVGGRVVAVGTSVVRALESAAIAPGLVLPAAGWTELVAGPDQPPRTVRGLLTGWHEPRSSHLAMLEAIAGPELLREAYRLALEHGYLWHEFGDSHLILP